MHFNRFFKVGFIVHISQGEQNLSHPIPGDRPKYLNESYLSESVILLRQSFRELHIHFVRPQDNMGQC